MKIKLLHITELFFLVAAAFFVGYLAFLLKYAV